VLQSEAQNKPLTAGDLLAGTWFKAVPGPDSSAQFHPGEFGDYVYIVFSRDFAFERHSDEGCASGKFSSYGKWEYESKTGLLTLNSLRTADGTESADILLFSSYNILKLDSITLFMQRNLPDGTVDRYGEVYRKSSR
jgi:hypothetical protein